MNTAPPPCPLVTIAGLGHLGHAVLAGLIGSGYPADRIRATTRTSERAARLGREHPVSVGTDNAEAARGAGVLVLTVRPDQADEVLRRGVPELAPDAAVISFVAGRPLDRIVVTPPRPAYAFRVATNTVSVERRGVLALTPGPDVPDHVHRTALAVLGRLGTVVTVPEHQQDLAASTVGSGAAFLAFAASGISTAAAQAGAEAELSRMFAADALESAAALLRQAPSPSEAVWEKLATAGGITEAGLARLRAAGTARALADAVHAAVARAGELRPNVSAFGR